MQRSGSFELSKKLANQLYPGEGTSPEKEELITALSVLIFVAKREALQDYNNAIRLADAIVMSAKKQ